MAVLNLQTGVAGFNGPSTLTRNTLTLSDTFTYTPGSGQWMLITNPTAGAITVTLTGSAPNTTVNVPGYGTVSAAGGKAIAMAVNQIVLVSLDTLSNYLAGNGTVAVTSTTAGCVAAIYS